MTKLTLGPIAYHWSAETRRDFYARIADEAPVDEVYLGEVICSKRAPFHEADLPATIERLERAGKTVIVSSLAEVMLKRERKATADLAAMERPEIEVRDDQTPGEERSEGVVLPVREGTHGEGRPGAGRVVHVHDRLRPVQPEQREDLLGQAPLGIVERCAEAAVQIPGPRQHPVAEVRFGEGGSYRGDDADKAYRRPLALPQPAPERHGAGGLIAV